METKFLETWENRSSIRARPTKIFNVKEKGYFFPIKRQVLFSDHRVCELKDTEIEYILVQSLFRYLNIIIKLELDLVNNVCRKITDNTTIVKYDEIQRQGAYTVLIDEYYHVYIANGIVNKLKAVFTEDFQSYKSDSIDAIDKIKAKIDKKYHDVFEIIAICIFETTLIGELVEFFNVECIHPGVRHYVNDHMNDEAKHAVFFSKILRYTWNSILEDYQKVIGLVLPEFLLLYLDVKSDIEFNHSLINCFFSEDEAENIITNIYNGFKVNTQIPMVKNVLRVLKNAGILDNQNIVNSFNKIGWDL